MNPITYVLEFLSAYGWWLVGAGAALLYARHKLTPHLQRWQQEREDAEHHKNPERQSSLLEAIREARERQQQLVKEASERALEKQREREELKRRENLERLQKYGAGAGRRLDEGGDYLPLSGGSGATTYRAPKRSACGGGGCGK